MTERKPFLTPGEVLLLEIELDIGLPPAVPTPGPATVQDAINAAVPFVLRGQPGIRVVVALLKRYDVRRVSELAPADLKPFIARLESLR